MKDLIMPKLLISKWIEYFIFSGDIKESRKHIHISVKKGRNRQIAKFWLEPKVEVFDKCKLSDKEINEIIKDINKNYSILIKQLDKFMSGKRVKVIEV